MDGDTIKRAFYKIIILHSDMAISLEPLRDSVKRITIGHDRQVIDMVGVKGTRKAAPTGER